MAQNDPDPNKLVKICPDCSYRNDASLRRCFQCDKSLAGVQPEPFPTGPLQKPLADETSISTMVAGVSSSQLHVRQILSSGQHTANGSAPSTQGAPTVTHRPGKPQVHIPSPGLSSYPVSPNRNSSGRTKTRRNLLFGILLIVLVVLVIFLGVFLSHIGASPKSSSQNSPIGLGEFKASNGELLGVNDGSFAPFLTENDGQLKQQAADQLKQGHGNQAISLWQEAIHSKNNDAEACIYSENQLILLSGLPYVTLVVGANLFELQGSGLSALQGVYVAQREFNNGNHGFKLRLLIANSGTDINNVSLITQRIVNAAQKDKTIVGVVSWLTSSENLIAVHNLSTAHIPMISPLAAADQLTGISPYFLRIIAPNQIQGKQSALFVERTLHARKAVLFVDKNDNYSQNAAQVFEKQFTKDGNTVLKIEPFTTNKTSKIADLVQDALTVGPDLLFFTGRARSDAANFENALPVSGPFAHVPALAGGAGYVVSKPGYGRWYFNADAYPDELNTVVGNSLQQPPFYQDYSTAFNEDGRKPAGYYGYTRPDSYAMLSYDVASIFSQAIQAMITTKKIPITTQGLQQITPPLLAQALPHVTLQGVSGWIAFDSAGNPINKAIVFLAVSANGIYMKDWLGCFTQTICRNVS